MLNGEEGIEREVRVNEMRLEHVSKFKSWDAFWRDQVQMRQNVVGR